MFLGFLVPSADEAKCPSYRHRTRRSAFIWGTRCVAAMATPRAAHTWAVVPGWEREGCMEEESTRDREGKGDKPERERAYVER